MTPPHSKRATQVAVGLAVVLCALALWASNREPTTVDPKAHAQHATERAEGATSLPTRPLLQATATNSSTPTRAPAARERESPTDAVAVLAGRVTWPDGGPAIGVAVEIRNRGKDSPPVSTRTTDADGRFRAEVPADDTERWWVTSRANGLATTLVNIHAPNESLELSIPVRGRLGIEAHSAESGERLHVVGISRRRAGREQWSSTRVSHDESDTAWCELTTDGDPVDLLIDVEDGAHVLGLLHDVAVVDGHVHTVALERGVTLSLAFRSTNGTVGLPEVALVRIATIGGLERPTYSIDHESGIVRCGPLLPGRHVLRTGDAFGFEPATLDLTRAPDQAFDVTWRIADDDAYEALLELEAARAAGVACTDG